MLEPVPQFPHLSLSCHGPVLGCVRPAKPISVAPRPLPERLRPPLGLGPWLFLGRQVAPDRNSAGSATGTCGRRGSWGGLEESVGPKSWVGWRGVCKGVGLDGTGCGGTRGQDGAGF